MTIWITLTVVLLLAEAATPGMSVFGALGAGAAAAALSSILTAVLGLQLIVFFAVGLSALGAAVYAGSKRQLQGRRAQAITAITSQGGTVRIGSEIHAARTLGTQIAPGRSVSVIRRDGADLLVH